MLIVMGVAYFGYFATRLNIEPENWIKLTTQFSRVFHGAVGRERKITAYCETLQKRFCPYSLSVCVLFNLSWPA